MVDFFGLVAYFLLGLLVFSAPIPFWLLLFHNVSGKVAKTVSYYSIVLAWAVLGYFSFTNIRLIYAWYFRTNIVFIVMGILVLLLALFIFYNVIKNLGLKRLVCVTELEGGGRLVTTGIYKYARHPRYVDYALFSLGVGLVTGYYVFLFFALYIFLGFWIATFFEEKELIRRFGSDYIEYKKKVPKFFIRL